MMSIGFQPRIAAKTIIARRMNFRFRLMLILYVKIQYIDIKDLLLG